MRSHSTDGAERVWALVSVPLFVLLLPLFLIFQPLASLLRRGCMVRQTSRRPTSSSPSRPAVRRRLRFPERTGA